MQAQSAYRSHPHDLRRVFVRSDNGEMLPVSSLVTLERTTGPDIIDRFNVYPAAKLMADPAPGYTIGAVSRQPSGDRHRGGGRHDRREHPGAAVRAAVLQAAGRPGHLAEGTAPAPQGASPCVSYSPWQRPRRC